MKYSMKNGTATVKVVCAVLFLVFTFCFLCCYQGDMLTVLQHVLSEGKTRYNVWIGGILFTLFFYVLQLLVYWLTKLSGAWHALTYFPSVLLLTILTDAQCPSGKLTLDPWWWLTPLLLIIYIGGVWVARAYEQIPPLRKHVGVRLDLLWQNLLVMFCLFFFAGGMSNGNDVYHYRVHAEACILRHDYQAALKVGKKSLATDSSLTMIRAYALAKEGLLGECLLEYPVVGGSQALLPNKQSVKWMMVDAGTTYRDMGLVLLQPLSPLCYLSFVVCHRYATPMAKDYLRMGYLLDKRLDDFAKWVGKFYALNDTLPQHYREALVLYGHLRSQPVVDYHHAVTEADFADYQQLERSEPNNKVLRQNLLRDTYGNTYWYYYEYGL